MSTDPITHNRREFLKLTSSGVSAAALSSMINRGSGAGVPGALPKLHHKQKAKSVDAIRKHARDTTTL